MALSDSDNADQIDPGGLPSGIRSNLGHVHTYRSAMLELNTHISTQTSWLRSLFRATNYHASKPACEHHLFAETMAISQYYAMVCSSAEVISFQLIIREKFEKSKCCMSVGGLHIILTMSL